MAENVDEPQESVVHPTLMESLTIIGASLTFVNDNWEEFQKAMEFADIDDNTKQRMRAQLMHLIDDIGSHLHRQEVIESVLIKLGRIFDQ